MYFFQKRLASDKNEYGHLMTYIYWSMGVQVPGLFEVVRQKKKKKTKKSTKCPLLFIGSSKDYERVDSRLFMKSNKINDKWNFKASDIYRILRKFTCGVSFLAYKQTEQVSCYITGNIQRQIRHIHVPVESSVRRLVYQ